MTSCGYFFAETDADCDRQEHDEQERDAELRAEVDLTEDDEPEVDHSVDAERDAELAALLATPVASASSWTGQPGDDRRDPWPIGTQEPPDGDVLVGGVSLTELATEYGTPVQVIAEDDVRARLRRYTAALPDGVVAYAAKAFLCTEMVRWVDEAGMWLDTCSGGELAVARAAGLSMDRVLLHGNAKTPAELARAHDWGVGRIVIDSRAEITQLALAAREDPAPRAVLLRVLPGVGGHTHAAIDTGREDQQFGFSIRSGAALEAVRRVLDRHELRLAGLHCHIGSQISDVSAFREAAGRMVEFIAEVRDAFGVQIDELDLGGGHAVAYRAGDPDTDPAVVLGAIRREVRDGCERLGLPVPRLIVEPGRAVIARAGVTVYRVVGVKHTADGGLVVAVDGGMSDNPRPCLYGARYTARVLGRPAGAGGSAALVTARIVGRHCEAGDVLVPDAEVPGDVRPGDLLATLCSGAYQHSMASNYNLVRRSPVIAVRQGVARVLVRRETDDDLLARDQGVDHPATLVR